MKKLVILESPGKAATVGKYLGKEYKVVACKGHLRDLPKSTLGVDIENSFTPKYIPIKGREKIIKEIKESASSADAVLLATDPDREGEAIAWHIASLLNLPDAEKNRVTFNEITSKAVTAGIKNPRTIDTDLVDAYQARRVLDRIVGYKLSPLLWKKIRRGLSAGRVQSVVTRLVVDRENEIRAFVPKEYWRADLIVSPEKKPDAEFEAHFYGNAETGKKAELPDAQSADAVEAAVKGQTPVLAAIKRDTKARAPFPPYITSTLQQDASRRLGYSSKRTMKLAQDLYEGMNIAGRGKIGLITYMRTDSLRLSDEIVEEARGYIRGRFGGEYLPKTRRVYKTKKSAQDAHEAIRPTSVELTPDVVKDSLLSDHYRLYKMIWERFIACQMVNALYDTVTLDITCGGYLFKASGRTLKFAGFTALYGEANEEEAEEGALPELTEGDVLLNRGLKKTQLFTQPPARYTEATLIRAMEEKSIGRPSTYAPTISTITEREYVEKEGKALKPTELGEVVTELMVDKFGEIIDVEFTARMEESLDDIAEGRRNWRDVVADFYKDFDAELQKAETELADVRIKVPDKETDVSCPNCGAKMVIKNGRFGKFLACPRYPECKTALPMAQETPGICPKCGARVMERKSAKGYKYYACEKNPACGFMTWDKPLEEKCPNCGKPLFRRYTREERKVYCAFEGCGYRREYKPRGKAKQTASGRPNEK